MSDTDRLLSKVDKLEGCWIWCGGSRFRLGLQVVTLDVLVGLFTGVQLKRISVLRTLVTILSVSIQII